jgi:hypothetical protein
MQASHQGVEKRYGATILDSRFRGNDAEAIKKPVR